MTNSERQVGNRTLGLDHAVEEVKRRFPFPGYISVDQENHIRTLASLVSRHLPAGASILDFGSGPAEAAAVLALTGYRAAACDDLSDNWHREPGVHEKILAFARSCGVGFEHLAMGQPWPWSPGQFDMVMINHVLEHIHDTPRGLLESLMQLVKADGYLLMTVPSAVNLRKRIDVLRGRTNMVRFDYWYWSASPWRGHVREYVRSDLTGIAEALNLDVIELGTYHYMLNALPKRLRGLWKLATAVVPDWRDSWYMVARKRPHWTGPKAMPVSDRTTAALATEPL